MSKRELAESERTVDWLMNRQRGLKTEDREGKRMQLKACKQVFYPSYLLKCLELIHVQCVCMCNPLAEYAVYAGTPSTHITHSKDNFRPGDTNYKMSQISFQQDRT